MTHCGSYSAVDDLHHTHTSFVQMRATGLLLRGRKADTVLLFEDGGLLDE
ncbi:MAG: hypothetical protein WCF85_18015 [Rhodospirillaceae bacterium]